MSSHFAFFFFTSVRTLNTRGEFESFPSCEQLFGASRAPVSQSNAVVILQNACGILTAEEEMMARERSKRVGHGTGMDYLCSLGV